MTPEERLFAAIISSSLRDIQEQHESLTGRSSLVSALLEGRKVHRRQAFSIWIALERWRDARDFFRGVEGSRLEELCLALRRDPADVRAKAEPWMNLPWNGRMLQRRLDLELKGTDILAEYLEARCASER